MKTYYFEMNNGDTDFVEAANDRSAYARACRRITRSVVQKNNWKLKIIMEQFGWTRKFLYHKILVELSDIYDLELEEKFYVQRFGYRPEYKLDLLDGSKSLARLATGYINYLLTEEGDY